jgi:pimeloyl-ACP methyl ester carboxylesterase
MPIQHAEADLGEVRLHYVTAGAGPAVLLLHGWPQSWRMWEAIIPGLADRYRVVAPDLRGLGDSARPAGGYDKRTVANDVWRLMTEVLGEQSFFLVGHDWGGPTAFSLAAQHRDAVKRMAIFDAPVPGDGSPVFHAGRWHHGFHWEDGLAEALTAGREDIYLRFFYRTFGGRPDCVPEAAQQDYIRAYSQPGAMTAGFAYYRAMQQDILDNEAMLARDGRLRMPVLCYGGPLGRGRGMGAIDSWRRVAEDVRGGIAEGCGHWIPEERPDWVTAQLLAFFGEAPG